MKPTLPGYKLLSVLLLATVAGFWALPSKAQTYGNEWIVPSQTYYKISTTKNGIHRLTYDWLTANIPGISSVNPQQLKLYRRGQEQSIYVQGEGDGAFNAGDYVEFYGQRNDGKLDVNLYKDPQHHVNTYYSMFSDTAAYFLTWSAAPGNRMQASSPGTAGLTPEPFHVQKTTPFETWETNSSGVPSLSGLRWPHSYQRGKKYQNNEDLQHSYGDESENFGFRSMTSAQGGSRRFIIDSLMSVPTGADTLGLPKPVLRVVISGNSEIQHAFDIRVGRSNSALRVVSGTLPLGPWEQTVLEFPVNFRDISVPTATLPSRLWVQVRPQASTGTIRLVFATLTYPQKFDLAGKPRIIYPDPNKAISLVRVANPPGNAIAYDLTNLSAIKRISGTDAGNGQTDFVFENTHSAGSETKMLIASADLFLIPDTVRAAAFGNISASDRDYLIISHEMLMKPAQGVQNPVNEYAQYRATAQGGNYKPVVAEMSQVVDQFHYGEHSAYAIRSYIDYMKANAALKMVFLVGKGLYLGYDNGSCNGGLPVRIVGTCYEKDFVPTFGFPASDLAYVMNFRNNDFHIKVPIGRLVAQTPDHVIDYLRKVQGMEALPENLVWRKNILHLVGGNTPAEMQVLLALMNQYKAIAQGLQLGGNVITRNKTSFVDPVQFISVAQEVNAGVSLMSYFGHASLTVADLDIGFVSDPAKGYNNLNKYPAFIMAGCATGNAYTGDNSPEIDSFGEDWTLTKDKGSLSFIAHSSLGNIGDFDRYMRSFYRAGYQDSTYGHPIGQVQQQTVANVLASTSNPLPSLIAMIMQMNLQGDPAVALYGPQKPDYAVNQPNMPVTLANPTGGLITADAPSLRLTIPIRNLGKALPDSISISVRRIFPTTSDTTQTFKVPGIYYADTAYFDFPGGGAEAFGLNTFEIWVDNTEQFNEIDELNNRINFEYFLPLSGVAALFPYNFSIVPTQQVTLNGQAFDILTENENYIFEIDTTHYFNSGWKKTSPVITADLLATWTVDLLPSTPANDSVVYFWRVRFNDLLPGEEPLWSTSSFTYIPGSPTGWSQSHLGQFIQDRQVGVSQDSATRVWEFEKLELELRLGAGGGNLNVDPTHGIFTNGQGHTNWEPGVPPCVTNGEARVLAAVFHPLTLSAVTSLAPTFLCGTEQLYYTFPAMNTQAGQDALATLLNAVPNNYYIALMTLDSIHFAGLSTNLKQAFENIGANMITTSGTTLISGAPYTLVAKKGDPTFAAQEHTADAGSTTPVTDQTIINSTIVTGARTPGSLTSTILGPAYEWGTLYHDLKQVQPSDSVNLKVIVRSLTGTDSVYYNSVTADVFNLAAINANVYPYLRLQLTVNDTLDVSPAQLKRWLVTYTPAPEGIIRSDINGLASYQLGTYEAGQQFPIEFKFQNISDVTFRDSVMARMILKSNGADIDTVWKNLGKMQPNEIATFTFDVNTTGLSENNQVTVFVNPFLQPEQYYTNNFMEATFSVRNDNLHPILDVVFDGEHIMDGDIVAPDPTITISLKDENKFLFKDDTVGIEVFLIRGENGVPQRITLVNNPEITVTPATANSDFRIVFEPKNLENGMYTLLVQGADKAGNMVAAEPYKIRFEVINESSITHFYPYPNPFTTSCKFVYTLTGSRIPDQMKIQILTMTGKVVREITRDELGQIRVGVNGNRSTDFSWDGTDEYGDKLANGVYLYRVVIGNKASDFEHRNTAADKAFKKDYGKLYILR